MPNQKKMESKKRVGGVFLVEITLRKKREEETKKNKTKISLHNAVEEHEL